MQLGLIGLGKMGANMRARIRNAGIEVFGYDQNPKLRDVDSIQELVESVTDAPRVIWLQIPQQAVREVVTELAQVLSPGDIVVDGGNTRYLDDAVHAQILATRHIGFVDCGVSGGIWGLKQGYALMVGGSRENIAVVQPVFDALTPDGPHGFVRAGEIGAGHFAKMVHNGIEYGMMQAYAEGWELLEAADEVTNVSEVFESWRDGAVIRSWLLDLVCRAIAEDPDLDQIKGIAADSGEGRWAVETAAELGVPVPAMSAALFARFTSQQEDSPAMRVVASMRQQFGGHKTIPAK